MIKKFFLSRKWLMAGSVLFLSVACQPKAEPSQQHESRKEHNVRPAQKDGGCSDNSSKPSPAECPKKECKEACPCPAECPKKECPCPADCPKKECKEACPCPPKKDCNSCAVEPETQSNTNVSQSDMQTETSAEAPVSSVQTTTENSQL